MHFNIKISLQFYVLHLYIKKKKKILRMSISSPDCRKGPWLQKKKKWKLSKMAKRGRWGRSLEAGKKSEPVIRELEWEGEGQEWTQSPRCHSFPAQTRHLEQCLEHEATKSNFLNEWKMEVASRQLWGGIYWAGPLSGLTSLERKKGQRGRRCCTKAGAFSEVWHWSRCRRLETRSELPQGKDLFIFWASTSLGITNWSRVLMSPIWF